MLKPILFLFRIYYACLVFDSAFYIAERTTTKAIQIGKKKLATAA